MAEIWRHYGRNRNHNSGSSRPSSYKNYFKNTILKEEIYSKCHLCKQHEETIDHLTTGCPILARMIAS
jgi:hypothetical protein